MSTKEEIQSTRTALVLMADQARTEAREGGGRVDRYTHTLRALLHFEVAQLGESLAAGRMDARSAGKLEQLLHSMCVALGEGER